MRQIAYRFISLTMKYGHEIDFNRTHINEISQHIDNLFTDQQATMILSKTLKHIRKKMMQQTKTRPLCKKLSFLKCMVCI